MEELANLSLREDGVVRSSPAKGAQMLDTSFGTHPQADDREKFMTLVTKARQYAENGNIDRAITLNEKALEIRFSEKLQRRIDKMKKFIADQDSLDDLDSQMKSLGEGFMLHQKMKEKLYAHQKEGVLWMWSLHRKGKGGILADDMGLGKTIQVIAFLAGMFDMEKVKTVLIVVPLSVMPNWVNEFQKWAPGIHITQFHGSSKKECERGLTRVKSRGGVVITTYGLIVTREIFSSFLWDYIILDEGHRIKNATKTSKSIHQVPAKQRLLLTGTPVQNNLKELWSLYDFVHQGSLLGTLRTFKMEFESPIVRARERDASNVEKKLGQEMATILKSIIDPFFLRRTKAEVSDANQEDVGDMQQLRMPTMTRKNELVIWLHLTETQQTIYRDFINLDHIKELLMTKKSPLVALTVLKKICDHPRLLSTRACLQLGLDGDDFDEEALEQPSSYESAATQIGTIPDEILVNESGKMQILIDLLDKLNNEGHRTLIFSQSRKLLDIIQKVIQNKGFKVARLDGKVTQVADRDAIVKKFQTDLTYSVFLLTVQVGGVGLTITAADRVIIYDPNWNPATDAQAVDRAFRIGQDKNVVVYRFITCGTVEEKIYRRQVFKNSITHQTTGTAVNPYRYFTNMELRELFALDDPRFSKTQRQLQDMHGGQRESDPELDEHIAFLHSLDIFGVSDHDLIFKMTNHMRDDEEDENEEERGKADGTEENKRFIEYKTKKAQMLIAGESEIPISYEERSKGAKRYPSVRSVGTSDETARPSATSQLFTQVAVTSPDSDEEVCEVESDQASVAVTSPDSDEEVCEVESDQASVAVTSPDSDEEVCEVESDQASEHDLSVNAVIDVSDEEDDKLSVAIIKTEASGPTQALPTKHERDRRALQPLSAAEIRLRSPQVMQSGSIVREELLISPDCNSPVVHLGNVSAHKKMTEDSLRLSNNSLSSLKTSSPQHGLNQGIKNLLSPSNSIENSPKKICSPLRGLNQRNRSLFSPSKSSIDMVDDACMDVMAPESPDVIHSDHDLSTARRQLSFVVADSRDSSPVVSQQDNKTPSKRRSVCVKPLFIHERGDIDTAGRDEDDENTENEVVEEDENSDEDEDKENNIMIVTNGRKNRIVSDSESEAGSCYEVESGDEDQQLEESGHLEDETGEPSGAEAGQCSQAQNSDTEDQEEDERFQNLICVARSMYKEKNYEESLLYVEEALRIYQEPELEQMAAKIRVKAAQHRFDTQE